MSQAQLFTEGIARFERWRATREPADLEAAIALFAELDVSVPVDPALRFGADLMHALALGDRYALSDSVDDIDGVIERLTRIVAHPSPPRNVTQDDIDAYRVALGRALSNRIDMYGRPGGPPPAGDAEFLAELRAAVDELAVAATTSSPLVTPAERAEAATLRAHLVPKLALTRGIVGRKAGELADIPELERVLRELPDGHPNRGHILLELGFAYMHLMLRPGSVLPSLRTSKHRVPAVRYLSQGVELLEPAYPERAKAIAFLAYLDLTRRPGSPDVAAGSVRELTAQALETPGLDPNIGAVLRLLASMTANPRAAPGDLAAAVSQLGLALGSARNLRSTGRSARFMNAMPAAVLGVFRGLLSSPMTSSPSLDDQDAADAHGEEFLRLVAEPGLLDEMAAVMPEAAQAVGVMVTLWRRGQAASERLNACLLAGDLAGLDAALAELERLRAELTPDAEFAWLPLALLGAGWRARGTLSGLPDDSVRGLKALAGAMDQAAACRTFIELADGAEWTARQRAASAVAELGLLTRDPRALTDAIGRWSQLRDAPGMTQGQRAELCWQHGRTLLWRHELTGDARDLDRAIVKLRTATRIAGEDAGYELLQCLSVGRWRRGDRTRHDRARALDAGLRALRARAALVLMQSGAAQGLRMARAHRFDDVIQLVTWCVAEGRLDQAVEALELSRAVVLHAATVLTDVPGLLTLAGEHGLADEWRAESVAGSVRAAGPLDLLEPGVLGPREDPGDVQQPLRIPSLLRRKVLTALHETSLGAQLAAVTAPAELGAALRSAGADAFAYLVPAPREGGCALLVDADGSTDVIALPGLSGTSQLDAYDAAYQRAAESGWGPSARLAWRQALASLCDWAWDAATGPVLEWLARRQAGQQHRPGGVPRVVLIPVGRLGVVPWHAARSTAADGRSQYAIEDAVFSYAASAGQFLRASSRAGQPWAAAPLLVSDPMAELGLARLEVAELRRRYYPQAVFLGQPAELADGPGTPDEVLSRLPGGSDRLASLVHCGCHAMVEPSLAASRLLLAGRRPLTIGEILAQAQRRDPASPGFLAVLSACTTDLANVDHDEALTLASALLAAGACGVIGARWPVEDSAAAPVMVMFHHFLNNGHPYPAEALRAAQLWLLDVGNEPPAGLPPELADAFGRGRQLAAPHAWAAFTCHGTSG